HRRRIGVLKLDPIGPVSVDIFDTRIVGRQKFVDHDTGHHQPRFKLLKAERRCPPRWAANREESGPRRVGMLTGAPTSPAVVHITLSRGTARRRRGTAT